MPRPPSKQAPKGKAKAVGASSSADRPEIVHSSIYVPKPLYQGLRRIAVEEDCKVHDLIMEGIREVLRRYGHGSDAPGKRKSRQGGG